jgi:phytoene dehydrogenase-like protein
MSKITRRGFVKGAALAPLAFAPFTLAQEASSTDHFDVVVAGAGHNSLVAAAYLAKAGYRCLVLEGRPTVGGGVKTAEVVLRGFKEDLCSTAHGGIQANPLLRNDELRLRDFGLEYIDPDPIMHIHFVDGSYLTQWRDVDRTCDEIARFSKKDADTYQRMLAEYESIAPILESVRFAPVGSVKPVSQQLASHPQGKLWQRRLAMSGYDLVRELYEDDHLRTFILALGHLGAVPPGDPMTGGEAFAMAAQQKGRPIPKGGSGELTQALARFIEAHNGVVLTNKPVVRLIIESGECTGVECADGSAYRARKAMLSTIHVKHLIEMAPQQLWGEEFLAGMELFEPEHAMFSAHYATTEPPKYAVAGGTLSPCESVMLASPERTLRFSYDNASGEPVLVDPPLQIVCPTVADPSRAPAALHTLKIEAFQPYNLKEGPEHWDKIKDQVAENNLNYLRRVAPNLTDDKILGKFVESPLDIERMNPSMWRGSVHGGANQPSQSGAMRPVPGWAQYRMPIPGLYQTGSTTHPGGSVTGAPGRNAAIVMLKDFGTSLEEVVKQGA